LDVRTQADAGGEKLGWQEFNDILEALSIQSRLTKFWMIDSSRRITGRAFATLRAAPP
jgi:hypothetical protein